MQISPIPQLDDETNQIRLMTAELVAQGGDPERALPAPWRQAAGHWARIQALVKQAGLWAPHLPAEYGGMGLGFLQLAYMYEILAWSPYSSALFGIMAPNSGNARILVQYGSEAQKKQWLEPLVGGAHAVLLRHDRARPRRLRSALVAHARGARRRLLGDQRATSGWSRTQAAPTSPS